jgi:NAD(P)H-hydrate epimerase
MEVLSVQQMYDADRAALAAGVDGMTLMENAGAGCARAYLERYGKAEAVILCGPGNNGGDGFVIARHLRRAGVKLRLALLGERKKLRGDAGRMAAKWRGKVHAPRPEVLDGAEVVVDALFGAGLSRPVAGAAAALLRAARARGLRSLAVDVPSGIDGDSGAQMGEVLAADLTVSFFRPKTGHLLYPGRQLCGVLKIVDIGIPGDVLSTIAAPARENAPALWLSDYPWPAPAAHKYARGHAVVLSGPKFKTGAARLSARAALRIGAGLVSVSSPPGAAAENAAHLSAVMVDAWGGKVDFARTIADPRRNAVLLGPGAGVGAATAKRVLAALGAGKACVLDADALSSFQRAPGGLFKAIAAPCIMTPHEGEFARLFEFEGGKLARARAAAALSGAIIVLKGPDSVIAAPDGRAAINTNAPPELATAGSGDVLAGFCLGLLAQGMAAFEAACAAVWLHGAAAGEFGPGLIAEDLCETLPAVLRNLKPH